MRKAASEMMKISNPYMAEFYSGNLGLHKPLILVEKNGKMVLLKILAPKLERSLSCLFLEKLGEVRCVVECQAIGYFIDAEVRM